MTMSTPEHTSPAAQPGRETLSLRNDGRGTAWFRVGVILALLGAFYLYIQLRIGPHLLYHQQCPIFLTTFGFLKNCLARPGGLLAYVSVFMAQLNYYPWIGAFVLTLTASLICLSTNGLLRVMTGRRSSLPIVLLPAVGLLILHNRYQYDPSVGMTLLAALALANVYVRKVPERPLPGFAAFLVSSFVVYAISGSAYVLYAILCGIFELVKRRKITLGALCLLCSAAVPYCFSMYSYEVSPLAAYAPLLPFREGAPLSFWGMETLPRMLHLALLLFFPVTAVAAGLYSRRTGTSRRASAGDGSGPTHTSAPATVWMFATLGLFFVVAVVAIVWSFDGVAKTRLEISYYARHGKWNVVLAKASRLPRARWTCLDMHDVNRALYHNGRLLDEMFSYPQTRDVDSLLLSQGNPVVLTGRACLKQASLYFELGHVNRALGFVHSALEKLGQHPEVLKLLVKIHVVKGQITMARTYLGALRQNRLYRNEAVEWLDRLKIDPDMTTDKELQRVRAVMLRTDSFASFFEVRNHGDVLRQLLQTNPQNRMAFEYSMAYYLWSRELSNLVAAIGRLSDFDYSGIPRHCEEGIVVYRRANPGHSVNLHGRRISDETVRLAREFFENCAYYADPVKASEAMAKWYGNSYLFYSSFRFCGSGAKPVQTDAVTGASK